MLWRIPFGPSGCHPAKSGPGSWFRKGLTVRTTILKSCGQPSHNHTCGNVKSTVRLETNMAFPLRICALLKAQQFATYRAPDSKTHSDKSGHSPRFKLLHFNFTSSSVTYFQLITCVSKFATAESYQSSCKERTSLSAAALQSLPTT